MNITVIQKTYTVGLYLFTQVTIIQKMTANEVGLNPTNIQRLFCTILRILRTKVQKYGSELPPKANLVFNKSCNILRWLFHLT